MEAKKWVFRKERKKKSNCLLGLVDFPIVGQYFIWLSVPVYGIISWVFHTMERIGRMGENPFEGLMNDVPISTIARGIEIDLRQNLGENKNEIPDQFPVLWDTQM